MHGNNRGEKHFLKCLSKLNCLLLIRCITNDVTVLTALWVHADLYPSHFLRPLFRHLSHLDRHKQEPRPDLKAGWTKDVKDIALLQLYSGKRVRTQYNQSSIQWSHLRLSSFFHTGYSSWKIVRLRADNCELTGSSNSFCNRERGMHSLDGSVCI